MPEESKPRIVAGEKPTLNCSSNNIVMLILSRLTRPNKRSIPINVINFFYIFKMFIKTFFFKNYNFLERPIFLLK